MLNLEFLQTEIAANSLQAWLIAIFISVIVYLVVVILRFSGGKHLARLVEHNGVMIWPVLLAAVRKTRWPFLFLVSLFIGSLVIELPGKSREIFTTIVMIALILQAGLWGSAALHVLLDKYREEQITKDPARAMTLNLMKFVGKFVLWTIVLLLVLDNLGVNITALVAGLGVGGIAVALAVQTVLGDLFASLSIVMDKPFVVGDFLIVGDLLGSVEYVGLKTTRLRSLSGEQLVFSNSDLLNSRIRNFGRMYERRVSFDIGVTYQTPRDKISLIPQIIREAVEAQDKTRFDRSHFKQYGDFALLFESVYYVQGPDYNLYMDIQQAINLQIHERFEQEGIEFAYPTQTLFVQQQAN
ncbi:MAG: mechanosensitive ion channel family protein [Gammaproteobacteria bacterium]|nr:mechanosensitive ion channel family protein [Gammaproteobacteria bacterium]